MKNLSRKLKITSSLLLCLPPALGILLPLSSLAEPLEPLESSSKELVQPDTQQNNYAYPYSPSLSSSTNNLAALEMEIASLQERVNQSPEDGLDRAVLAHSYLKMARITGDNIWYLRAEKEAKQSLINLPFYNQGAITALARVAESKHDFATAIRLAEQASGAEAIAIVATSNLAMGRLDQAAALTEQLVNLAPTLGSLTLRGLTYSAQGNHAAAIEDFTQAIAVEQPLETRGSALVRSLLGRLYFKQGNFAIAEQLYREALKIVPDYPQALLSLGELKIRQGDYQTAMQVYSQVDDPLAQLGIARAKALAGKDTEAREAWDQVELVLRQKVEQNPLDHRRELAQVLLERQNPTDLAEAIALMQAEVTNRQDAQTLDTLAWALSRGQRWQEAQQVISKAIAQGTQDPIIFYRAGMIENALQNQTQAERYFQLVTELDPTFDRQAPQNLALIGLG